MRRKFFPVMLAALLSKVKAAASDNEATKEKAELHAKRGYFGAQGEYHPRKHTKSSYRAQQRAAKKRKQTP